MAEREEVTEEKTQNVVKKQVQRQLRTETEGEKSRCVAHFFE